MLNLQLRSRSFQFQRKQRHILRLCNTNRQLRLSPCLGRLVGCSAATENLNVQESNESNNGTTQNEQQQQFITFQDAIAKLQIYWASKGCVVLQPHNCYVGAGTMNPATFLRVLGPEPWSVAYVEPSVRPDDSRYGQNPNRVQKHTQFQVILKPDPGNAQELYLGSLEAIGIDTKQHDIRFVEDNWESPALGAWGLGWEVWLDGMEVTQFTYFQQSGGCTIDAPAVEIAYGLERIIMSRQNVNHFKDIRYSDAVTYGELCMQEEQEWSQYYLEQAPIEYGLTQFNAQKEEAERLLKLQLPLPAYDQILSLSHMFNVLDARGAVGMNERQTNFATMRQLCRSVSALWLERRKEQDYPLGQIQDKKHPKQPAIPKDHPTEAQSFLLELGQEELPPDDVQSAIQQLKAYLIQILDENRLTYADIHVSGTPRRLVAQIDALAPEQESVEETRYGPAKKFALNKEGEPTKALTGFCRGAGVAVEDAKWGVNPKSGDECVMAVVKQKSQKVAELMVDLVPKVLSRMNFVRSMRWQQGVGGWSRPVRWLCCMYGGVTVPVVWNGLVGGNVTRGLRSVGEGHGQDGIEVASASAYQTIMQQQNIIVNMKEREQQIWDLACAAAQEQGGIVPESSKAALLQEVTNLVEAPGVAVATFEDRFLELPSELLVMVMQKHQRYFPIVAPSGELLPRALIITNGPVHQPTVIAGNEAVLRARFEDASFFYKDDCKDKLSTYAPLLSTMTFHASLGSMADKAVRVRGLVADMVKMVEYGDDVASTSDRAAELYSCDQATSTVKEMSGLAGIMGGIFAKMDGESEQVAKAIQEARLPVLMDGELPESEAGALVGLGDRLDSVLGFIAAGYAPTGAKDPYQVNRLAGASMDIILHKSLPLNLLKTLEAAQSRLALEVTQEHVMAAFRLLTKRLESKLRNQGYDTLGVRSVIGGQGDKPVVTQQWVGELDPCVRDMEGSGLLDIVKMYARCVRISKDAAKDEGCAGDPDVALFEDDEEKQLWECVVAARGTLGTNGLTFGQFKQVSSGLVEPVSNFFRNIRVLAEDESLKSNRLKLVMAVANLPKGILDLSVLPGW